MSDFFAMGGYAGYVWPAFGFAAVVLLGLLLQSWRAARRSAAEFERAARPSCVPAARAGRSSGRSCARAAGAAAAARPGRSEP